MVSDSYVMPLDEDEMKARYGVFEVWLTVVERGAGWTPR
jgi:hypothetical protein